MSIGDEKTVSCTTFRKSGEAVATATWITSLEGGKLGFWTSSASGKAKRLRNNPRLTLQPSDQRGRVKSGSAVVSGTATIVVSGPEYEAIQQQITKKYRAMVPISKFFNMLGHIGKSKYPYGDICIVVTPEA